MIRHEKNKNATRNSKQICWSRNSGNSLPLDPPLTIFFPLFIRRLLYTDFPDRLKRRVAGIGKDFF
jgi:hypothetical protein